MAQSKSGFPIENVAFLVSWLEEPCHFDVNPHAAEDVAITKSLKQIAAINDVVNSETDYSFRIGTATREQQYTSDTATTTASEIVPDDENDTASLECGLKTTKLHRDLCQPGVAVLLNEYYKLLDDRPSQTVVSTAYQYRPSLVTQMWHIATAKLPPMFRFSNVVREANLLVRLVAPANAMFIVAFLILWIILLRLLLSSQWIVHPAYFVAFACLGIYFLSIGDAKRKEAVRTSMQTCEYLEQSEIGEDIHHLSPSVLAYLDCQDRIST